LFYPIHDLSEEDEPTARESLADMANCVHAIEKAVERQATASEQINRKLIGICENTLELTTLTQIRDNMKRNDREPNGPNQSNREPNGPNARGPTVALSFRLNKESRDRVEAVCRYLSINRSDFFKTAISKMLQDTESQIRSDLKGEDNE